jgi:hypothetical protein
MLRHSQWVFMRATRVGSVNERFFKRFERDAKSKCWNWTGPVNAKGYGLISGILNGKRYVPAGRHMLVHRVSWIIHRGDIPDSDAAHGMVVMHTCDNPRCVNPDHLRLGTQADNIADMDSKRRHVVGEFQKRKGVEHHRSSIKAQEDLDLILSTTGQTKELAERFGVDVSTIKRIRRRNGVTAEQPEKYKNKPLTQEAIDYIRSTPPGTRGLGKMFGVGKTTIANIRKGLTHAR